MHPLSSLYTNFAVKASFWNLRRLLNVGAGRRRTTTAQTQRPAPASSLITSGAGQNRFEIYEGNERPDLKAITRRSNRALARRLGFHIAASQRRAMHTSTTYSATHSSPKMAIHSQITVHKLTPPKGSKIDFGAEIRGADLENITPSDFEVIRRALNENQIIIFKNQQDLSPKAQYELTRLFDPTVESYGHGKTLDAKKSILHPDLKTIPHQPQVQVIGNGPVAGFEGLKDIVLKHPHHKTFHANPIPESEDRDKTRFYRWHIDAALYDLNPPRVTSLMAVKVPKTEYQTLRYDDGSNDSLQVPRGSTAFVSSYLMYDILSEEDKAFVRSTKVQYAPHPYIWMSGAKSRSDGLGMVSEGKELPYSELPPIEGSKIKVLPMCWRNPVTGRLALQVHPSAVEKLHLADGTVIEDLEEVREIVHRLQRPGIAPESVYAVDWEEGDLALFNNHGVLHSVTGSFLPEEVRIFRQCNLASSEEPLGPLPEGVIA
jgi:xanthine dioxygenase